MGSDVAPGTHALAVLVAGTGVLERVELVRSGAVVDGLAGDGSRETSLVWTRPGAALGRVRLRARRAGGQPAGLEQPVLRALVGGRLDRARPAARREPRRSRARRVAAGVECGERKRVGPETSASTRRPRDAPAHAELPTAPRCWRAWPSCTASRACWASSCAPARACAPAWRAPTWSEGRITVAVQLLASRHLEEVLVHEVAHLVCFWRHGRVRPHGREWRALMQPGRAPRARAARSAGRAAARPPPPAARSPRLRVAAFLRGLL